MKGAEKDLNTPPKKIIRDKRTGTKANELSRLLYDWSCDESSPSSSY